MSNQNMTNVDTATLTGAALDWAVAKAEGMKNPIAVFHGGSMHVLVGEDVSNTYVFSPSSDWAICGQLVDKYEIDLDSECGDGRRATMTREPDFMCFAATGKTSGEAICRVVVLALEGPVMTVPVVLVGGAE